ncbi:unnamed protein product [Adineta steineri]|uniref:G-protein coupled receptors family 1 profile domain-containing protein n=2 Tax=Adineta steineri TaxID=433720 RepID=A0A818WPN4_9BILA|nr:unnamed protein product [Adineta steineri]CAF3727856.1 unnamed protein product [Adineta steineri]
MSSTILSFATKYSIYSGTVICSLGIVGNVINILVFTQLKVFRDNRCAFYLTIESIFNFLYMLFGISVNILISIYGDDETGRSLIWCKLRYIIAQTLTSCSFTMVCCTAADEYFSTNYRCNLRQTCTLKLARYLTFILICIWTCHSIIFGYFSNIMPSIGCTISNENYRQYATFFFYPVLGGVLPIVISSFFSMLAYRNVRRIVRRQIPIIRRRLDRQITAMVLLRIVVFICLTVPSIIYHIYAINTPVLRNTSAQYAIVRLLQIIAFSLLNLNHMSSFYVFIMSSSRFRHQVKYFLIKKCWKHIRCCHTENLISPGNAQIFNSNIEHEQNN